jgi:prepilin signal peptidase PulO-like enzyme (type II secretory pathway)
MLRGRCRKCHKKIGIAEILAELAVATAFTLISTTIDVETATLMPWLTFVSTLLLTLSLSFLGIYDGLYGQLPCFCLTISLICAIIYNICAGLTSFFLFGFTPEIIISPLLSALFFGGIYLLLYLAPKCKLFGGRELVGDGDWLLAGIIGFALGSIWLSFFALFIANLSACLIMLPAVKKSKNSKIYFGPFLVLAFVVVYSFATQLLSLVTF